MSLPNYFMADLGNAAPITPSLVSEACLTLKRNREQYLVGRTTGQIIGLLCEAGALWLDPTFPLREMALQEGPTHTGFSRETLQAGIDAFFSNFTKREFEAWIAQEFGLADKLDGFNATDPEIVLDKSSTVIAPELAAHVASGNLPNPAMHSLVTGLLLRSAQFMKCASGASLLPRLFAHTIHQLDSKVASTIELAEWKGGAADLEAALFSHAQVVTATGTDEAIASLRRHVGPSTRFVSYGRRASFAFVSSASLTPMTLGQVTDLAAQDIAAWDQNGCLSPHVIYVETGSAISGENFAESLARSLQAMEVQQPRGQLPVRDASVIASRRAFYEIRAASSQETKLWASTGSTAWTVVFEFDPLFQTSCLNRFIYVKNARNLEEALHHSAPIHGQISTVALHETSERIHGLAARLARWGVPRICRLGSMQRPSLAWRHDGHPALGELVSWSDWEH